MGARGLRSRRVPRHRGWMRPGPGAAGARAEADRRSAATRTEVLADLGPAPAPVAPRAGTAAVSIGPTPAFTDDGEAVGLRFRY